MDVKKFPEGVGVQYTINELSRHSDGTPKERVRVMLSPGPRTKEAVRSIGKALQRAADWFK